MGNDLFISLEMVTPITCGLFLWTSEVVDETKPALATIACIILSSFAYVISLFYFELSAYYMPYAFALWGGC